MVNRSLTEFDLEKYMARPLPTHPKHPERICWGCDKLCSKNDLACGNGAERTPHPVELFGEDWLAWELSEDDEHAEVTTLKKSD